LIEILASKIKNAIIEKKIKRGKLFFNNP